jgi:hypothetical protein
MRDTMHDSHTEKMAISWSALRLARHFLEWVRDLVRPSLTCVLLQSGVVETSTREEQTGETAGIYVRVRIRNRSAAPSSLQAVEVSEKKRKVWKVEALILFPQHAEILLPLALAPAEGCEIGLRALSPGRVFVGKQPRASRVTLRLQDHRGRWYRLKLQRKRMVMPQPWRHATP